VDPRESRGRLVMELAEDTTGFGLVELRTARDLLLRPAAVLDAYMTSGVTGGGRYARPLRFYMALCGLLMVVLFLSGGMRQVLAEWPAELLDPLLDRSGKSREMFLADVDSWISLVLVPVVLLCYALVVAPLLKAWDRSLNWRRSFRAVFAFLCAWTLPILPLSPLAYRREYIGLSTLLLVAAAVIAFIRMGRGRWWLTWQGAVVKSLVIAVASVVTSNIGMLPVVAIGLLGAIFGP